MVFPISTFQLLYDWASHVEWGEYGEFVVKDTETNKYKLFCTVPTMKNYVCFQYFLHGQYFEKCGEFIKGT